MKVDPITPVLSEGAQLKARTPVKKFILREHNYHLQHLLHICLCARKQTRRTPSPYPQKPTVWPGEREPEMSADEGIIVPGNVLIMKRK